MVDGTVIIARISYLSVEDKLVEPQKPDFDLSDFVKCIQGCCSASNISDYPKQQPFGADARGVAHVSNQILLFKIPYAQRIVHITCPVVAINIT